MSLTGSSVVAVAVLALVAGFCWALGSWFANRIVSRP